MKIFKFFLNAFPRPLLIKLSYWVRPMLTWYYKGATFTDPIDGKSYRKFLPYGYGIQRENALSPGTLSLERHRLLWLFLQNETDFFGENIHAAIKLRSIHKNAQLKVLHVAPEQCFLNRFKRLKNIDYLTTDLLSPIVDVKADICNLPFDTNSFDVVFCNHVLEHIPDDTKAMQELYRVLKPKGMGIFQIPQETNRAVTYEDNSITDPKERSKIFGQYDHVRVYGLDYFDKLRAIGFDVNEVRYSEKISPVNVEKYCLMKGELLPVCYK